MFKSKRDRKIVELVIEFNLGAISKWLTDKGGIEDIEKIDKKCKDCVIRSYRIDVLPNGETNDMYFHREKGLISNSIGGIDYINKSNEGIERFRGGTMVGLQNVGDSAKRIVEDIKIWSLSWSRWRQFLSLEANKIPILLVPVEEFAILQTGGKLDNHSKTLGREERAIQVPVSFSDDGKPKDHIEVLRSSASSESVSYHNALASVSASTLNFEVEY